MGDAIAGDSERMHVLIVEAIDREVVAWLSARHPVRYAPELARDPAGYQRALGEAHAVVVPPGMSFGSAALAAAPWLRAVARVAPGAEGLDLDACAQARVEVVRPVLATAAAEAEFIIGAVLKLLRRLPEHGRLREGRELGSSTVGLVGMSPTARSLSQMLVGFGCSVTGYDPSLHANDGVWARWRVKPLPLRDLMSQADVVCVQLQYYTRYKGLLGERLLPHCKSNQVIVSVSPSAVFDDVALARALDHGVIAAAWLDHPEPGLTEPGRPLHGVRRLCTSPQLATQTRESRQRSAWSVVKRLDELLAAPETTVAPAPKAADAAPSTVTPLPSGAAAGLSSGHALR